MACVDGEIFQSKRKSYRFKIPEYAWTEALVLDLFKGKFGISKKHQLLKHLARM